MSINSNLKVFTIKPNIPYSGGVILIAAKNKFIAKEVLYKYLERKWFNHTYYSEPEELENVYAECDEPKVILDKIYIE